MPARDSVRPSEHYSAGDLEIEVGARRVYRDGRRLRISGLTFDLLLELARSAPNTASVQDLLERVWPARVVNPETVSQRVKLLRAALGDDSHDPRYIGVERGRGYRLLVPVSRLPDTRADLPGFRVAGPLRLSFLVAVLVLSFGALIRMYSSAPNGAGAGGGDGIPSSSFRPPANTVAVLRFENLGRAESVGMLGAGVAEAILHRLANQDGMDIIARTSSFALSGGPDDVRTISRKLNARYVLEGSVQQSGDNLRVTAQLVDAASGTHVWSRQYDSVLGDIFAIQDDIAADVADSLELSLRDRDSGTRYAGSRDLEAYLAFLRGRELLMQWRVAGTQAASGQFQRAIDLDPAFARAYTSLAEAKLMHANLEGDLAALVPEVEPLLERALALDPRLGEAWILRARARVNADPEDREGMLRRGLELSPNSASGFEAYANFLLNDGRHDAALEAIERAIELDPLTARNHYIRAMCLHISFGRTAEAESTLLHALELDPAFHPALMRLAEIRRHQGRFAEAIRLGEQSLALDTQSSWVRFVLAEMYLDIDDRAAAGTIVESGTPWIGDVLLPLHAGERELAAAVARSFPGPGSLEQPHAAFAAAVRDMALADGESGPAIDYLADRLGVRHDQTATPTSPAAFYPYLALASLLRADGRAEAANGLLAQLDDALAVIDARRGGPAPPTERIRAQLRALTGQADEALDALERAFAVGGFSNWWYDLRHNPVFDGIRGTARFRELLDAAADHAAAESAEVERLRVTGRMPRRSTMSVGYSRQ